jgi:multicomponent Na+:H+ antiporter subunit E
MSRFVGVLALTAWAYLVWLLLTWTRTAEQLLVGAGIAVLVALTLAPLGRVARPWRLAEPPRAWAVVRLIASALWRILRANLSLARRIWSPSLPLRSGMIVLPTAERSDAGLAGVGLISSLIVDNQIVDLDRDRNLLQYHAVSIPAGDPAESVNRPVERLLGPLVKSCQDRRHRRRPSA